MSQDNTTKVEETNDAFNSAINNIDFTNEFDDFITVKSKKKTKSKNIVENMNSEIVSNDKSNLIMSVDDIKNNIEFINLLKQYNPYSVILYGSFVKSINNDISDDNLMFVWKKNQKNNNFNKIRMDISKILNKHIDTINLVLTTELQYFEDYKNSFESFIYNVQTEGIVLYGEKNKECILKSKLTT
jgi:hypothetical protein